jgi:outer membrane protein assembly factor BamB
MVSPAARRIYAYAPLTGHELWHVNLEGLAYNNAPRPIFVNGVCYVCTGYERAQLWAIRVDAKSTGDVTDSHVLWKFPRGPLKPSPLIVGNEIYFVSDDGIARALDAATGAELWHARIGNAFSASPIYANNRLYFFGEGGRSIVCAATRQFKLLADNFLQAGTLATPAISEKSLYLRTKTHLYRLEQ